MGENYNNPMDRLNESRNHYKGLLNEAGIPGMCCPQGGPACVGVTFANASENCSSLGMNACTHADCQGDPIGPDDPVTLDDNQVLTVDTDTDEPMKNCINCDNGSPVGNQVPQSVPCSSLDDPQGLTGWVEYVQGVDPCEGTNTNCDFPTMSATCALTADLVNQFVSGDPTQFLSNMATWYANPPGSGTGCDFLEVVRQKHIGHLQTGIAINGNHPNGIQMGPAWIAQKTSKVAYLDCILADLNAQGCCDGTVPGNGGPIPGMIQGKTQTVGDSKKKGMERKGMKK